MVFSKDSSGVNEEHVGEVADGAIMKTPEWSGWLSGKLEYLRSIRSTRRGVITGKRRVQIAGLAHSFRFLHYS